MDPTKQPSSVKGLLNFVLKFITMLNSQNMLTFLRSMVLVSVPTFMLLQMKAMHLAPPKGPSVPYEAVSARGQMNVQTVEVSRVEKKPVL